MQEQNYREREQNYREREQNYRRKPPVCVFLTGLLSNKNYLIVVFSLYLTFKREERSSTGGRLPIHLVTGLIIS